MVGWWWDSPDNGAGIAAEDLPRVGGRPSTTTSGEALGSAVWPSPQRIVRNGTGASSRWSSAPEAGHDRPRGTLHRGDIVACGARLPDRNRFRFPWARNGYDARGQRILVVDDEQSMTQFLAHRAAEGRLPGHDGAATAATPSSRSRPETFDVVITDIKMPGMDGIQLLQAASRSTTQRCRS